MVMTRKITLLLFFFLFLQACASNTTQRIAPVPVEDRSVDNNSPPGQYPSSTGTDARIDKSGVQADHMKSQKITYKQPMLVALLEDAEAKMDSGDTNSAAASLERALRLDSKNAMLWHRLGLLRLRQKNWQQAINLALKSNSLAAGDHRLQADNWKLIAQANSRAGDKGAAKRAAEIASKLEQ